MLRKYVSSQRGNVLIVIPFLLVILSGMYVMSQNLLLNNIENRSTVVDIVQESYDMDSVKNVVRYATIEHLSKKRFDVETTPVNGNFDHSIDFTKLVFEDADFSSIRNDVLGILSEDIKYADVYVNLGELRLGDFCMKELNSVVCDSSMGTVSGTISVENKDRRVVYDVTLNGIDGEVLSNVEFGIVVDSIDVVIGKASNYDN